MIFSGDPVAPGDFTREATAQEYFPEWLLANSPLVDTTAFSRTYDQEQWQHAFGISQLSARTLPEVSGYYSLYQWFSGAGGAGERLDRRARAAARAVPLTRCRPPART